MKNPNKLSCDETTRRLDLWLWFARFFKSRTLATRFVQSGRLRVNGQIIKKAHHSLRKDDILTFPKANRVLVVKVINLGIRRGPSIEAQALYEDMSPPVAKNSHNNELQTPTSGVREPGTGRPTKQDRRALEKLRAH